MPVGTYSIFYEIDFPVLSEKDWGITVFPHFVPFETGTAHMVRATAEWPKSRVDPDFFLLFARRVSYSRLFWKFLVQEKSLPLNLSKNSVFPGVGVFIMSRFISRKFRSHGIPQGWGK